MRLRQGDTDREIARSRLMGRRKTAAVREIAQTRGWLDPDGPLPDDATLEAALEFWGQYTDLSSGYGIPVSV